MFKQTNKWLSIVLVAGVCFFSATRTLLAAGDDQVIDGGKWKIIYHSEGRTVDYTYNNETILSGVYVKAKNNTEFLNSSDYENIAITKESVSDVFGTGDKFSITYQQAGKPDLQQIFYFYPNHDYFLTEAYIQSATETSSNYIAPVVSFTRNSFLPSDKNNRALCVPFDNDAWVRYSSKPLTKDSVSFEVTSIFNGTQRQGLVMGSVEHDTWKTGIRFSTKENQYVDKLECFGGITHELTRDINPAKTSKEHGSIYGKQLKSPKILVGFFADWRKGMDQYGEACALVAPPRGWANGTPFGWNSWGAMATKVNYNGVLDVSDYIKQELQPKSFENNGTVFIGLDSYWNDNFTDSQLRSFVNHCKENGQGAGIYWGPFSDWNGNGDRYVEGTDGKYKYKDISLYANGKVRSIASNALDPTHPGTKEMIAYYVARFKKLGFNYIKLDFINNGTLEADSFYDKTVTTGIQAYNHGMKYLSDLCGPDVFLALSIAPSFPAQYGNSKRLSCDVWGEMSEGDATTGYLLNSLSFGWWLDKVYDYNDADHLVLDNYAPGANRARITSGVITGIYMLGDNLSQKGTFTGDLDVREQVATYATNPDINDIARLGQSFYPVEGYMALAPSRAENFFMLNTTTDVYFVVFNYQISSKSGDMELSRLGISSGEIESVKELWSGTEVTIENEKLHYYVPFQDVKVYRIRKKGTGTSTIGIKKPEQRLFCYAQSGSTLMLKSDEELTNVQLVSTDGKVFPAKTGGTNTNQISIDGFPKGVYIVWAKTKSGQVLHSKFIM